MATNFNDANFLTGRRMKRNHNNAISSKERVKYLKSCLKKAPKKNDPDRNDVNLYTKILAKKSLNPAWIEGKKGKRTRLTVEPDLNIFGKGPAHHKQPFKYGIFANCQSGQLFDLAPKAKKTKQQQPSPPSPSPSNHSQPKDQIDNQLKMPSSSTLVEDSLSHPPPEQDYSHRSFVTIDLENNIVEYNYASADSNNNNNSHINHEEISSTDDSLPLLNNNNYFSFQDNFNESYKVFTENNDESVYTQPKTVFLKDPLAQNVRKISLLLPPGSNEFIKSIIAACPYLNDV